MAPNLLGDISPLKRTAEEADLDDFGPLTLKRRYHHHHKLRWRQEIDLAQASCESEASIHSQLIRALALALQATGFEYADPLALESLRAEVEEFMAHFLATVRQSMQASRRSQPVPRDFVDALYEHQLTLHSLLPHLDPPVDATQTQPPLQVVTPLAEDNRAHEAAIAQLLHEAADASAVRTPRGFPTLPSRHTYKAQPVYPRRENDPKVIRERATEEGRRGEESLRRLASGRSVSARAAEAAPTDGERPPRTDRAPDMFVDTMSAITRDFPPQAGSRETTPTADSSDSTLTRFLSGHVPPPVNWDRGHWRRTLQQVALPDRAREPRSNER